MTFKFNFHSDPGHGWMEFPKGMINMIPHSIAQEISSYSYHDKTNIYLEEDCDATIVMKALSDKGYTVNINEVSYDNECHIRQMASYPGRRK